MHQIAQLNARFELWTSQRATYFTKHSSFAFFDHYFNQFPILLLCECLKMIFDNMFKLQCRTSFRLIRRIPLYLPSKQSIQIHFVIYLALVWYNQRNIHDLHSYNDWDKCTIKSEQLYQILSNDHFRVLAFYPILKKNFETLNSKYPQLTNNFWLHVQ